MLNKLTLQELSIRKIENNANFHNTKNHESVNNLLYAQVDELLANPDLPILAIMPCDFIDVNHNKYYYLKIYKWCLVSAEYDAWGCDIDDSLLLQIQTNGFITLHKKDDIFIHHKYNNPLKNQSLLEKQLDIYNYNTVELNLDLIKSNAKLNFLNILYEQCMAEQRIDSTVFTCSL